MKYSCLSKTAFLASFLLMTLFSIHARAEALTFSYADPVEDHFELSPTRQLNPPPSVGIADLTEVVFNFDNETGNYEITMETSSLNPFIGAVRIAIGLFNPDTGTTAQDPSFFSLLSDFSLTTATTTLILTGTDPKLMSWNEGDRVAPCYGSSFVELGPCNGGLGLPDGIAGFASGSIDLDATGTGRDVIYTAPPAIITSVYKNVEIDIKPGSDTNCINVNGSGVIPVAILGSATFDVTDIIQSSLKFAGLDVGVRGNKGPLCGSPGYSNDDEYLDLVCHFDDNADMWNAGSGQATLFGTLIDGTKIKGTGSICIVP